MVLKPTALATPAGKVLHAQWPMQANAGQGIQWIVSLFEGRFSVKTTPLLKTLVSVVG